MDWWTANSSADPPPVWSNLQNPEKARILRALLKEQKYVCVYCGASITGEWRSAHIEHFWPQSQFGHLRFDWTNMFASCGPATEKNQPIICGDAKGDWTPTSYVHPVAPDCELKFCYNGLGHISASSKGGSSAGVMIETLNLGDDSLNYLRSQIIKALEEDIAINEIDASTVIGEISSWRTPDDEGRLKAFGHVAARYLEDKKV